MSSVNKNEEKLYVITYKELIFTFIVFSSILFVLYPKDLLKEQILSEKSNYDLSMLYLKNLLIHSPEDESLMLILAEQSLRSGNKDLSLRLLQLLFKSENKEHRERALLLGYELKKDDYYYVKDPEKKAALKKSLEKIYRDIYFGKMYKEANIEKWYKESLFFNHKESMHYFLNKLIEKDPTEVALLEKSYYLELELKHQNHAMQRIKMLQKYDTKRFQKWVWDEYYTYINFKQYRDAEKVLLEHASQSKLFKQQLAAFYLMRKKYKKSSMIYEEMFKATREYEKRKFYFFKLVEALQAGHYFDAAADKVKRYESYYIEDKEARKFMLKIYIATDHLDYADNLANAILTKGLL
jgi:phage terminase large subunit-like protein